MESCDYTLLFYILIICGPDLCKGEGLYWSLSSECTTTFVICIACLVQACY